jgi:hypothetical protein
VRVRKIVIIIIIDDCGFNLLMLVLSIRGRISEEEGACNELWL